LFNLFGGVGPQMGVNHTARRQYRWRGFFWGHSYGASRAVIASAAKQSSSFTDHDWRSKVLDCFVASAPRNDDGGEFLS
jgi:hypothetical protein